MGEVSCKSLSYLILLLFYSVFAEATDNCDVGSSKPYDALLNNMILKSCVNYLSDNALISDGESRFVSSISTFKSPAESCEQIASLKPSAIPGYNWIKNSTEHPVFVYCTATTQCCQQELGWTRIAHMDMTDPHQTCPQGFRQINSPKRACGRTTTSAGCNSVTFKTQGISYSKVCGRVIGYHFGSPSAFYPGSRGANLDGYYVEGVSITHGMRPRKHIWSFANALQETTGYDNNRHVCPCTLPGQSTQSIPQFVGNDYFCDSGSRTTGRIGTLYTNDPLWDGHGCEERSTCCSFNNPSWFCKELNGETTDDIEVRICADEGWSNEDSPVELIELYVK